MLAIGSVELISLLMGLSPSAAIESVLPEIEGADLDAPDVADIEVGPLSLILGWLSVGRVPILVLLVFALTSFGLAGYVVQWTAHSVLGAPLDALLASLPALVAAAYATRHLGRLLGRIFPRDHSEAASQTEMVGSFATIIRGEARRGAPAEAKASDLRGRTHYLLVEPDAEGESFSAGQRVFIVGQRSNVYRAVIRIEKIEG
jgi:hypothetical protein